MVMIKTKDTGPQIDDAGESTCVDLDRLLADPRAGRLSSEVRAPIDGAIVGQLVAIKDGVEPLITYPGQPGSAAITARATIDLCAEHIGQEVVLVFEEGDSRRPIITGRIRTPRAWPTSERFEQV